MKVHIDYEELKSTIDSVRVMQYGLFEYRNRTFCICLHRHTKEDEKDGTRPVFWQSNSTLANYDIYLPTNVLRIEFRKPVLLHEFLEAFSQREFRREFDVETANGMAHRLATRYDKRYAREKLNDSLFQEYSNLRKKLLCSFAKIL